MRSAALTTAGVGAVLVLAWLALSGPDRSPASPSGAPASAADVGYPRTLELPWGETVTIARRLERVVPGAAGSADLACALLAPERIAALPGQALRYSGVRDVDSPYLSRPQFHLYEAEPILSHQPELVLAHAWQVGETTLRLQEAGVLVVTLPDPVGWADVASQLRMAGRLFGEEARAEALVADGEARIEALASRPSASRGWTALAYSNGGAGGWVAGTGTTCDEILRLAGLRNLAAENGRQGHTRMTFEELLVLEPDVFVVGGGADAQEIGGTAQLLRNASPLGALAAVRDDAIVVLEPWLYTTTSHHIVDAAEEVRAQLDDLARRITRPRR